MTSNTFNQQRFIPTPPDKGSFPLDHEHLCKKYYILYMSCLRRNDDQNAVCRQEARDYLDCRMRHQLMESTTWDKLGFKDQQSNQNNPPPQQKNSQ